MNIQDLQGSNTFSKVAILIPEVMRERIFPRVAEEALMDFAQPVFIADDMLASGDIAPLLRDVKAVITGWKSPTLPSQCIAPLGSIEFLAHAAGSVKRLGVTDALEAGHIRVSHAAPVIAQAVAEFTLAQILAHLRHHRELDAGLRHGTPWFDLRENTLGTLLGAQDVGIVGLGYVGRLVMNLLRPFGCKLLVYDPFISAVEANKLGVTLVSLEEMFDRCMIVSLHAANLPATEGMITRQLLERLARGSLLVNTARAGLIEPGAMLDVLQQSRIFAAIDTFDIEPLPDGDVLRQLHNVYLSPHSAGHTRDSYIMQGLCAVEEVRRFFSGKELSCEIQRDRAATLA